MSVGTRSSVPCRRSVAWLQRGCATAGFTLAQKPYSVGWVLCQEFNGCLSVKLMRTIDLTDLKPYFQGTTRRIGAPSCFGMVLPYMPVAMKARSFVASAMARPSL